MVSGSVGGVGGFVIREASFREHGCFLILSDWNRAIVLDGSDCVVRASTDDQAPTDRSMLAHISE